MSASPPSLKIGIIGVGGISKVHRDGYLAAGAEVVALADPFEFNLRSRQREWEVERAYVDFAEMFADGDVDAISICAPTAVHAPATLAAAAHGVHVLCEKPLALDLGQGQAMIDACREAGVVLQVGHQLRSHGAASLAKEIVERGDLGRVTHLRLRQAHDWAGASEVRASFATKASSGGGTLLDNGCHMMDLARYFGHDVEEVFARTATLKFDVALEDTAHVSLRFRSGALGTVEAAWTGTGWEEGFWIYGTEGALEYTNRLGAPYLRHAYRRSPGTTWGDTDVSEHRFAGGTPHGRHVRAFLETIVGAREPICTGEDGLEAVRLVFAAYESAERNESVRVAEAPATMAG
ncbi:Gfo/Idh/MocA family oxidoreductase [soil metagenome]|nr:Gfo/Idh/MocA family oxidoreductase [Trueperaceae bacterium]